MPALWRPLAVLVTFERSQPTIPQYADLEYIADTDGEQFVRVRLSPTRSRAV